MKKATGKFQEAAKSAWTDMTCGADAAEFLGKIVAFKASSRRGWTLYASEDPTGRIWHKPGSSIYFGYVSDNVAGWAGCKDKGPALSRVLMPGYKSRAPIPLIEERLKGDFPKMRLATKKEKAAIREAIASSEAKLQHSPSYSQPEELIKFRQALGLDASAPQEQPKAATPSPRGSR